MLKKIALQRLTILGCAILVATTIWVSPWKRLNLDKVHSGIELSYRNVEHIDAPKLLEMNSSEVVLFDVREIDEFDVSHIQDAIRLGPDTTSEDFESEFSETVKGKTVVFYCSVGMRSSALASQLEEVLEDAGAESFYNLTGGLFKWHNQSRQLVQGESTATDKIHPYDDYWGKLIQRRSLISH